MFGNINDNINDKILNLNKYRKTPPTSIFQIGTYLGLGKIQKYEYLAKVKFQSAIICCFIS